jgi:hypothetical protein
MNVCGVPASSHTPGSTWAAPRARPTVGVCGRVMNGGEYCEDLRWAQRLTPGGCTPKPLRQLGVPRALIMAAQCRFSVHRMNQWWVERNRGVPTDSILAFFAGPWRRDGSATGLAPESVRTPGPSESNR